IMMRVRSAECGRRVIHGNLVKRGLTSSAKQSTCTWITSRKSSSIGTRIRGTTSFKRYMKTKPHLKSYKNFISNQWVASKKTREIVNPFNGQPIAFVAESGKKDVDEAVRAAREAFDRGPWRESTAQQRGRILFAMADLVRKHSAMLAELETVNCGKPIVESEFDMNDTASCFEYYGGQATKIHGETLPVPDNALNMTRREP